MKTLKYYVIALCLLISGLDATAAKFKRPDSYNYLRGYEAFENDEYEEALDYFNRDLKENPKNGYSFMMIAYIRAINEEYGRALNAVDQAVKYLPSKDVEYMTLAYLCRAGINLELQDTAKALVDFDKAIQFNPKETSIYKERGQLYYEMGKYDLADADYNEMIKLEPGSTTGYMGLGRNANERKQWDEAIRQFSYVAKLEPEYSSAYSFRAESYIGQEKWNEATDDLIKAMQIDWDQFAVSQAASLKEPAFSMLMTKMKVQTAKSPNDAMWPFVMGYIYESGQKYEKAIECYRKANNLDASQQFYARMSNCYYSMGNSVQALDLINKALNMDSTDTRNMWLKSEIFYEMGDLQQAIAMLDKMIEMEPDNAMLYHQRGRLKQLVGNFEDAIEDLSMSIVLDPKEAHTYYSRGEMYKKQGKTDLAEADYKKVIELEPKPEDYSCSQYAYLGLGQYDKAIAVSDTIMARDTTNVGEYYNAACLYSRMNQPEKALQYLRKCLELGYRHFGHMRLDSDLDNIRDLDEYNALIQEFSTTSVEIPTQEELVETAFGQKDNEHKTTEVPFTKEDGVCKVKCNINGLPLFFVFDTGASDVTISMVEATFMVKNGFLTDNDIVGSQRYMDANGNVSVGTTINLKSVDFGGLTLNNVRASVVRNQKAPLLLGQSVLGRLGKIEIDNNKMVLRITH